MDKMGAGEDIIGPTGMCWWCYYHGLLGAHSGTTCLSDYSKELSHIKHTYGLEAEDPAMKQI